MALRTLAAAVRRGTAGINNLHDTGYEFGRTLAEILTHKGRDEFAIAAWEGTITASSGGFRYEIQRKLQHANGSAFDAGDPTGKGFYWLTAYTDGTDTAAWTDYLSPEIHIPGNPPKRSAWRGKALESADELFHAAVERQRATPGQADRPRRHGSSL